MKTFTSFKVTMLTTHMPYVQIGMGKQQCTYKGIDFVHPQKLHPLFYVNSIIYLYA